MLSKSKQKLANIRQQPEEIRLRAAYIMTAVILIGLSIIALGALLPLQIYLYQPALDRSVAIEEKESRVSGTSDVNR